MQQILDAILSGTATADDIAAIPVPESYRAVTVHKDEQEMFAGVPTRDKDPRKSLHVEDVPLPELGPGEALVAVMASSVNYNTVWTSIFEPVSTFGFLERYGRTNPLAKRHDLPYHQVGSDLSGVVLRTGPGVHTWNPGDEVVAPEGVVGEGGDPLGAHQMSRKRLMASRCCARSASSRTPRPSDGASASTPTLPWCRLRWTS